MNNRFGRLLSFNGSHPAFAWGLRRSSTASLQPVGKSPTGRDFIPKRASALFCCARPI
jgi:hypothetical protein